ncbi:MAG: DUF4446 family protein [Lachnospiraceae bacterium]|jgi:hypothetical protein|nr:DUF4446 family protein [Lachnospiraceae bacterium]
MENSILNRLAFDPAILIFVLAGLVLVLLVVVIVCIVKMKALFRKYDLFMRGKDAESMEESFLKVYEDVETLKQEDKANKDMMKAINITLNRSYQKTSVLRYDAFPGMGGQFSFVMTLLDRNDSGVLLNCIHSRESCYLYIKEIIQGESALALSKEETKSLEEAKKKH